MDETAVFHTLNRASEGLDAPVVTIGNFDGVHLGHRAILDRAVDVAVRHDCNAVALTFSPHPVRYFRPDAPPFRLTTDGYKHELLLETGIDGVVSLTFDEDLAELSPSEFVDRILDSGLSARHVIVGSNFRFGRDRAGSTDDLRRLTDRRDIACETCEPVTHQGDTVSSTRIREAVRAGRIEAAASLLDRPYRLAGRVVRGDRRGRELGYPTANLEPQHLVPGNGIYATRAHGPDLDGQPAATSIGVRPTYGGERRVVEAHVLDWEGDDLYGVGLDLEFGAYLREERAFDSDEELIDQMANDVEAVRSHYDAPDVQKADSGT
ncbi:MAG: bifunctional riboflavin kinase/FAD synthetase [Bradymonadaceae bacterium]